MGRDSARDSRRSGAIGFGSGREDGCRVSFVCQTSVSRSIKRGSRDGCAPAFPNTPTTFTLAAIITGFQGEFPVWGERPEVVARRCGVVVYMWRTS